MEQLRLTDLFDAQELQSLQKSLSAALELSVGIIDENGVMLTNYVSHCEFCHKCTKNSKEGQNQCQSCDKYGAEMARKNGSAQLYICHAGLINYAVPIIVDGKYLGCMVGGQVLHEPLSEEQIRAYAQESGLQPEECMEAAKRIPLISKEKLNSIVDFLGNMVNMLFLKAYKQYEYMQVSEAMERETHMKSDFLANMSHEIRTPMNAVIGMAEMALREDLSPAAREYIKQIMGSGKTLLAIINDILDFSKIESGKMDINLAEYEPFDIVKDISNVIMTRIGDKNLEFIVDVAPDIPRQLMGDSIRIRQIIINLANNAVKFTQEGFVRLSIDHERKSDREILLKISVEDTGIGIKQADMKKLFQSFQQLDSKRNRNVEGTGLGLAISKQLVTLMNGHIWVDSTYEKGSCFSFEIPQFVIDDIPSVNPEKENSKVVGLFCANTYVREHMKKMFGQLHMECLELEKREDLKLLEERNAEFLFLEHKDSRNDSILNNFISTHPQMTGVIITGFKEKIEPAQENVITFRKPLDIMNVAKILAHENLYAEEGDTEEDFEFIAPEAEILVVDDNKPNLIVAEGILAPLQMKIDKASSGKQALEMIDKKHYDLIFMDHMMPELDGVETTHLIRRFHEDYNDVPIIALTANVMEETRAMFLVEGMNDFVAKPIELKVIVAKLKQWLPQNKIKKAEGIGEKAKEKQERLERLAEEIVIPGLDVRSALQLAGSDTLFWQILKEYAKAIPKKSSLIQQCLDGEDWKRYTIEVHALKSFSRQVGALELSELAAKMEQAGNNNDTLFIYANHNKMMERYRSYGPILARYAGSDNDSNEKKAFDAENVRGLLDQMLEATNNLDMDVMEDVVEKLGKIELPSEQEGYLSQMQDAVEDMDVETCESVVGEWKKQLS